MGNTEAYSTQKPVGMFMNHNPVEVSFGSPKTLNSTRNADSETLKPKAETLNPKPKVVWGVGKPEALFGRLWLIGG